MLLQGITAFHGAAESSPRESTMRVTLYFEGNINIDYDLTFPPAYAAAQNAEVSERQLKNRRFDLKDSNYWATFMKDENSKQSWILGSSFFAPLDPEGDPEAHYGFWAREYSLASGQFENPNEVMKVEFDKEIDIPDINIVFDRTSEQYCTEFDIIYQSGDSQSSKETKPITGNNQIDFSLGEEITGVKTLWIVPRKWSHPYEQFRMSAFFLFQPEATYDDDDLYEVKIIESCEQEGQPISAGLNRLSVRFNNANKRIPISFAVPELKICPEFTFKTGTDEEEWDWIPMGTFFATDWKFENGSVFLEAADNLDLISNTKTEHPYLVLKTDEYNELIPMGSEEFLRELLTASKKYYSDLDDLNIQPGIKYAWKMVAGHIQPNDYKSILTEAAASMGSFIHMDRQGNLAIWPYDIGTPVYSITPANRYLGKSKTISCPTFRDVTLKTYHAQAVVEGDDPKQVVYEGTIKKKDSGNSPIDEFKFEYFVKPCGDLSFEIGYYGEGQEVPGIEIEMYSEYAICKVDREVIGDAEYGLIIKGIHVAYEALSQSFTDDYRSSVDAEFDLRYLQEVEDTDPPGNIRGFMERRFKNRRARYEIECRGNPALELGDTVAFVVDQEGQKTKLAVLTHAEYTYNGALRAKYILKGKS